MAKPVILAVDDPQVLRAVERDLRPYPSLDEPLSVGVGTRNGG